MKRLFVAVDISEEARSFASGLMSRLRSVHSVKGLSWSKPKNLHITTKFLCDTDPAAETKVADKLHSIAASYHPFNLYLDKPELLGKHVIAVSLRSDSQTVFSLEMAIDTECEKLGFKREGRRFHPHLTLARIRRPEGTGELMRQFLQTQIEPLSFEVREIVLYESELGPGGSIYKAVKRFGLNG